MLLKIDVLFLRPKSIYPDLQAGGLVDGQGGNLVVQFHAVDLPFFVKAIKCDAVCDLDAEVLTGMPGRQNQAVVDIEDQFRELFLGLYVVCV